MRVGGTESFLRNFFLQELSSNKASCLRDFEVSVGVLEENFRLTGSSRLQRKFWMFEVVCAFGVGCSEVGSPTLQRLVICLESCVMVSRLNFSCFQKLHKMLKCFC